MCFTPWISLSTALIEFFVATFILIRYKDYLIPAFSAILIYVLGLYQFTEFMLCTTDYVVFWATLGFATYTFLPAIAVHMAIRFTKEKFNNYLWYIPPVIFSAIAFLKENFIISAGCEKVFVTVITVFTSPLNLILYDLYLVYYGGFILIAGFLLVSHIRNNQMRQIYIWWAGLGILTIVAPIILIVILPSLEVQFPSVYCEFALLFSIVAVVASEIYHKKKKKERLIK